MIWPYHGKMVGIGKYHFNLCLVNIQCLAFPYDVFPKIIQESMIEWKPMLFWATQSITTVSSISNILDSQKKAIIWNREIATLRYIMYSLTIKNLSLIQFAAYLNTYTLSKLYFQDRQSAITKSEVSDYSK